MYLHNTANSAISASVTAFADGSFSPGSPVPFAHSANADSMVGPRSRPCTTGGDDTVSPSCRAIRSPNARTRAERTSRETSRTSGLSRGSRPAGLGDHDLHGPELVRTALLRSCFVTFANRAHDLSPESTARLVHQFFEVAPVLQGRSKSLSGASFFRQPVATCRNDALARSEERQERNSGQPPERRRCIIRRAISGSGVAVTCSGLHQEPLENEEHIFNEGLAQRVALPRGVQSKPPRP